MLEIEVPAEEIVKRLSGRRVHEKSGRVYHVVYNPPKVENRDDETGEVLVQRKDDAEATVRERLSVYHDQTYPLVDFYSKLAAKSDGVRYAKVKGIGSVETDQRRCARDVGASNRDERLSSRSHF